MTLTNPSPQSDTSLTVETLGQTILELIDTTVGLHQYQHISQHAPKTQASHGAASLLTAARTKLQDLARPFLNAMTASELTPQTDTPRLTRLAQDPYFTRTSLGKALYLDDLATFRVLVDLGLKPNSLLPCGYTILGVAIILASSNILDYLLTAQGLGAQTLVNGRQPEQTPMVLALDAEQMGVFERILASNQGHVPSAVMVHCCGRYSAGTLGRVVSLGGSVWAMDLGSKSTTLHAAVDNADLAIMDYLLGKMETLEFFTRWGVLGMRDRQGHTPLTKAVAAGRYQHLARLIRVCDTGSHAENADGTTVLYYAAQRVDVEMVKLLVAAGCRNMNNWAPGGNPFSALIGAYREMRDHSDNGVVSRKQVQEILQIAKLLLSCNGDPFAYGEPAQSPFSQAKKMQFKEFVQMAEDWREKTIEEFNQRNSRAVVLG